VNLSEIEELLRLFEGSSLTELVVEGSEMRVTFRRDVGVPREAVPRRGTGLDAPPREAGPPVSETLSIGLTCTNGTLPEALRVGDISQATSDTPEIAEFRNITPATFSVAPPLGTNLLWRLISHLSLNHLSLARGENLRALLELYLFPDSRDRVSLAANKKRIAGIEGVDARPSDRLVGGLPMRGQEVEIRLRQDHFAGPGDMYLFGCVLDHFLGN